VRIGQRLPEVSSRYGSLLSFALLKTSISEPLFRVGIPEYGVNSRKSGFPWFTNPLTVGALTPAKASAATVDKPVIPPARMSLRREIRSSSF